MTFEEHRGPIAGRIVAWAGDGNNMATSWIQAAVRFDFTLRLACPKELGPPRRVIEWARQEGGKVLVTDNIAEAVTGADCVVTDTWVSMGEEEVETRYALLPPYRVDDRMMSLAKPNAIFMHCLPAHRREEVAASVIDGPHSAVWDEAANRLPAQQGILVWCLS
jgi:ornithine carbamoyltransferase